MRRHLAFLSLLLAVHCASSNKPNEREWNLLAADYQWIQTLRSAQKVPPATAPRKQQMETLLDNLRKIEPTYVAFMDKLRAYYDRTGDPRAADVLAKEKVLLGDQYMNVLARYDMAIRLYKQALEIEPSNAEVQQRVALAERRRYVSMSAFAAVKAGMGEEDVRKLVGFPREDWIKQVLQNNRVYSVWIYPKSDGGASAIYFDNGVVYHTNWNAAAPTASQTK